MYVPTRMLRGGGGGASKHAASSFSSCATSSKSSRGFLSSLSASLLTCREGGTGKEGCYENTGEKPRHHTYRRATAAAAARAVPLLLTNYFSRYTVAGRVSTRVLPSLCSASLLLSCRRCYGSTQRCFKFHTFTGEPLCIRHSTPGCTLVQNKSFRRTPQEAHSRSAPFMSMSHPRYILLLLCHSGCSSSTTLLRGLGPRCHHGAVEYSALGYWKHQQRLSACRKKNNALQGAREVARDSAQSTTSSGLAVPHELLPPQKYI